MLWTIFVILLVLWLLGIVTSYTLGGFIHLLLVIALVVLLIQLITGAGRFFDAQELRVTATGKNVRCLRDRASKLPAA